MIKGSFLINVLDETIVVSFLHQKGSMPFLYF